MRFTKMHGAGNDYVYVNCFQEALPADLPGLARRISDRRFGVGGDGLILILPSQQADARMQMFNADGSEAEMCGNGIRCVAKYVYDHGIAAQAELRIETKAGVLSLTRRRRRAAWSTGFASTWDRRSWPPSRSRPPCPAIPVVDVGLSVAGRSFRVTSVSMGNPHCVIFVEQATDELVLGCGPQDRGAIRISRPGECRIRRGAERREVRQRTWERGSGETWACGTGASAVCVAGVLTGRTARRIVNHLRGGDLELHWDEADNHVYMTGPAAEVFSGDWPD